MGIGNFLFVPLSMMIGRRAVFLFNNVLMLAAIIWAAKSDGFSAHLAARCLQGLSCGISDCLVSSPRLYGYNTKLTFGLAPDHGPRHDFSAPSWTLDV
jgi:hypothetical protein